MQPVFEADFDTILYYKIQSVCVSVCVSVCEYVGDEAFAGDSVGLGLGQRLYQHSYYTVFASMWCQLPGTLYHLNTGPQRVPGN